MSLLIDIKITTTFENLANQIKGNGEILPFEVTFRTWPEEDSWVEPGMKALLVDVVNFNGDFVELYFFFGNHEEYNFPFFKKEFFRINQEGKNELVDAFEHGSYKQRKKVILPKDYKVYEYLKFTR